MQSLYEYAVWRDMQGTVIRPGGLDLTNELLTKFNLKSQARVLDLGCGCGASLRMVQERFGCNIYGLDIARQLLGRINESPCEANLIQANAFALPLAAASFDAILLECVSTIFGTEKIFASCKRLLKPGGKLLVADLYARKAEGIPSVRELPTGTCIQGVELKESIENALTSCDLSLEFWSDYSDKMKNFPMRTLSASLQIDLLDLLLAANSVELGYYGMIAEK
jgi:arsenite methyltransferase